MSFNFPMYMEDMVKPMREELTRLGIKELRTADEVVEISTRRKTAPLLSSSIRCAVAPPVSAVQVWHLHFSMT